MIEEKPEDFRPKPKIFHSTVTKRETFKYKIIKIGVTTINRINNKYVRPNLTDIGQ